MKIIRFGNIQFTHASHEDPKSPGVLKKVILKKGDLIKGDIQMINWAKLPVGKSFQLHYHEDMEEIFVIINGKVEIIVGNKIALLNKGDTVVIPIKAKHRMKNIGDSDVEYIAIGVTQDKNGKTVVC